RLYGFRSNGWHGCGGRTWTHERTGGGARDHGEYSYHEAERGNAGARTTQLANVVNKHCRAS
ncbi:MAG TPA: hypothetical protein VK898_00580, partial [Chloroflexota bacterium]|nr:hypothetical protein [Chloroflexota bacterium]